MKSHSDGPAEEVRTLSVSPAVLGNTHSAGLNGSLVVFLTIVGLGALAYGVGALRLLLGGKSEAGIGLGTGVSFFALGFFLTVKLWRSTPLYWKLVFALIGLSSCGHIMEALGAGRAASRSDVSWMFWSTVWFLYWTFSRRVALTFPSSKSKSDSKV
jgi:hypothetical protein